MTSEWTPPQEWDDYELVRPLGRGAMGVVWLAQDTVLARHVAVKFVGAVAPSASARQRFLLEARAAARIQHPNVAAVYRVGEVDGRPFIVSEFVRGQTLAEHPKPVAGQLALEIGVALSRGLAAAHRKGVLHCDLKPANCILSDDGAVKLFDFGLATLVESPGASRQAGVVAGTPDYLAPEAFRGEPPSRRTDVYSLGALLYELCAGKPPFAEVPDAELAAAVQAREPRPVRELAPELDPRLAAVIDLCLRRSPAQRPESGDTLREALEDLQRPAAARIPEGNPYRGLRPFELEHRALFFGRSVEIGTVIDRLRSEPFVLVAGDSGAGKSSLCRAGVLPLVVEGALAGERSWSVLRLTVGRRPLAALLGALAGLGDEGARAAEACRRDPAALLLPELRRLLGADRGLLLFVDQLEELLTLAERGEAAQFEELLAALAGGAGGIRLLATLRADFLTRAVSLPRLGEAIPPALYLVRALSPERLREAIVGPAAAVGVRFESEEQVRQLVLASAASGGGLPLLQFALAELWEARDQASRTITRAALDSIGGLSGALARHGDQVLAALLPAQRRGARRILTRLVSAEGTRARRSQDELTAGDPIAQAALEALTRGRLVVAHETEAGGGCELAHEYLIQGWPLLSRWLQEDVEGRLLRDRLAQAAGEWERLGRSPDALWGPRQLAEAPGLSLAELAPREAGFLERSRRRVRAARWLRRGLLAGVPLLLALGYGGLELRARARTAAEVGRHLEAARQALAGARARAGELEELRRKAFAWFDAPDRAQAEETWARALLLEPAVGRAFVEASQSLESALALDPASREARSALADVLLERAAVAEAARRTAERDELLQRLALYDEGGVRLARWNTPATLRLEPGVPARVAIERYQEEDGRLRPRLLRELAAGDPQELQLQAGSYRLTFSAPQRPPVRYPLLVRRGEQLRAAPALPPRVPEGWVYVPAGRFLFGSGAEDAIRQAFLDTAPLHEVRTPAYLIARTEVTFGQWLKFLAALPPAERKKRLPGVGKGNINGAIELAALPGGRWRLTLQSGPNTIYRARDGEFIEYRGRRRRARQDWRRFPVVGISADDAEAYVAWLATSGQLPGARLCSELEWERAARGADDRDYPHGSRMSPDDANYDLTYQKDPQQMGLDEVGSHPASESPFGLQDASGNAFEWTTSTLSARQHVGRGGAFYYDFNTCRLTNRQTPADTYRDATLGFRPCADAPGVHD